LYGPYGTNTTLADETKINQREYTHPENTPSGAFFMGKPGNNRKSCDEQKNINNFPGQMARCRL
jgi:hypothetical protein